MFLFSPDCRVLSGVFLETTMTAQEYISAGYSLSAHIEQARIDKAESQIQTAYIAPMCPTTALLSSAEAKAAKMALTVLYLARRQTFATRAGGREKLTSQSNILSAERVNAELVSECYLRLKTLQELEGANPMATTTDICGVFFKTNFFNI